MYLIIAAILTIFLQLQHDNIDDPGMPLQLSIPQATFHRKEVQTRLLYVETLRRGLLSNVIISCNRCTQLNTNRADTREKNSPIVPLCATLYCSFAFFQLTLYF